MIDSYDNDIEILPPDTPTGKFRMVVKRKPHTFLREEPKVCIVCEQTREASNFTPVRDDDAGVHERAVICSHCKREPRTNLHLPWHVEVKWNDRVVFEEAVIALRILEIEIKNAKRHAHVS